MKKGQAFLVVGHSHWGKSQTLLKLTHGKKKTIAFKGAIVVIKRMSNDDDPKSLFDFVRAINPKKTKFILIAFCPNFANTTSKTLQILKALKKKYELYFFVLKKCYKYDEQISPVEAKALKAYGKVKILKRRIQSGSRAKELKHFILRYIKTW